VDFGIGKGVNYTQTSNTAVGSPNFYCVFSVIAPDKLNAFMDPCTVTYTGVLSPISMVEVGDSLPEGDVWYGYSPDYTNQADLDAALPAGTYKYVLTGDTLSGGTKTVTLPASIFSPQIPQLTGTTYSRLQTLKNSLNSSFSGTINGFTDNPASNASQISIVIEDLQHHEAWYEATLTPSDTSFTIPASTIDAGRAYFLVMYYELAVNNPTGGRNGGSFNCSWERNLFAYFNTRGPCPADLNGDGVVDDADFVLFAAAYNLLYCSNAAMPEKCPADLNNDGYVDDTDFPIFAIAYDQLLCKSGG
jgi:hypothetical protein